MAEISFLLSGGELAAILDGLRGAGDEGAPACEAVYNVLRDALVEGPALTDPMQSLAEKGFLVPGEGGHRLDAALYTLCEGLRAASLCAAFGGKALLLRCPRFWALMQPYAHKPGEWRLQPCQTLDEALALLPDEEGVVVTDAAGSKPVTLHSLRKTLEGGRENG